jgi:CBS domain-containing protein
MNANTAASGIDARETAICGPSGWSNGVDSLFKRHVISIRAGETVCSAARLMREQHIGYLVVTDEPAENGDRHVIGVLTDRDIVITVVAPEVDPQLLRVSDVMTPTPLTVQDSSPIDAVLLFMREARVRRVPVVGARNQLVGVLRWTTYSKRSQNI